MSISLSLVSTSLDDVGSSLDDNHKISRENASFSAISRTEVWQSWPVLGRVVKSYAQDFVILLGVGVENGRDDV